MEIKKSDPVDVPLDVTKKLYEFYRNKKLEKFFKFCNVDKKYINSLKKWFLPYWVLEKIIYGLKLLKY